MAEGLPPGLSPQDVLAHLQREAEQQQRNHHVPAGRGAPRAEEDQEEGEEVGADEIVEVERHGGIPGDQK